MTRPFVPGFDALWEDKKARLHNATRAIFLRLCQKARDAQRDGEFVLQPERDDVAALMRVCPGPRAEFVTALQEMTDSEDPMIALDGPPGRRVLRILSWESWALLASRASDSAPPTSESATPRRGGRPRKWESEADRSRARRASYTIGNPTGKVSGRPDTKPVTDNRSTGNQVTGYVGHAGGERGGLSGVQTKRRSEEIRRDEEERARAHDDDIDQEPLPDTVQGLALGALRQAPELVRCAEELGLDLAKCALDLAAEAAKEVMNGKVAPEAAGERVVIAIGEVADKVRAAAATPQPWGTAMVAARLVTFARTNLRKPASAWAEERRRANGERSRTTGMPQARLEQKPRVYIPSDDSKAKPMPDRLRQALAPYGNGGTGS